jgi:hypothetical protein
VRRETLVIMGMCIMSGLLFSDADAVQKSYVRADVNSWLLTRLNSGASLRGLAGCDDNSKPACFFKYDNRED